MSLTWIESTYSFPRIDTEATSYFTPADEGDELVYRYGFNNLPQMKGLMAERLEGKLTRREMLEAAKDAFRNKPSDEAPDERVDKGDVVDFVYQF